MHLLIIGLFMLLYGHDAAGAWLRAPVGSGWALAAVVLGPRLALVAGYAWACRWALGRLGSPRGPAALRRVDRLGVALRLGVFATAVLDLWAGLLVAVRGALGDLIVLDELLVLTPSLALIGAAWWCYYPIERRLREAGLIARVDAGLPLHPIWTRGQYLLDQFRHQVALVLAPLLLIMAWTELAVGLGPDGRGWIGPAAVGWLTIVGAGLVFAAAPLIVRHLWSTETLPPGELRHRLEAMCAQHRVGVRDLLMWKTHGGLINAAVMGLAAPLRYILLTDGLLETMPRQEVEAVMAHELGHVRHHHLFWLLGAAVASLTAVELGVYHAALAVWPAGEAVQAAGAAGAWASILAWTPPEVVTAVMLAVAAGLWASVFGWVSRRVERQADTFAVKHLTRASVAGPDRRAASGEDVGGAPETSPAGPKALPSDAPVTAEAAATMIAALGRVAALNHIPPRRRSWRHGSIAARQAYLRRLVGRPVGALPVDREVRWIQLATLAGLTLAAAAWSGWLP